MKDGVVTARVTGDTLEALKEMGQREDRSVSYLVRKALERFVLAREQEKQEE